jgi:nitroreductase
MDAHDFSRLLRCRRSVRRFDGRPVEPEKLELLLRAAQWAPSSCNLQPWHVVVADRPDLVQALATAAPVGTRVNKWMDTAPVVLALCAKPHPLVHQAAGWIDRDCHRLDIGILGEHICLMATALGLGSCWIGWFSEGKVRELLAVPESHRILALVVIGYPGDGIRLDEPVEVERRRKPLAEIVSRNRFGDAYDAHQSTSV